MNNKVQNDNFLSQTFCTNALYGARVAIKVFIQLLYDNHYLLKNHIIIYRKKGKKFFMQKYAWIKRYLDNRIIFRDIFVIIFLFNFMPFKETGIKDDFYTSCRCETETSRNLYFKFIKNWLININNIKYIFIRK